METLLALEFVGAVAGADGGGQRIAAGPLDEFDGFLGIGEAGVAFVDFDVFFDAAELPSSASTLIPLACARSTTRLVIAMFSSNDSWLASIMTEL